MVSAPLTAGHAGWPRLLGAATTWRAALRAGLAAAFAALRGTQQAAHHLSEPVKHAVEAGAVAAAEGAVKVAHAPAELAAHVRKELDEWWTRVSKAMAEGALLAILGVIMLIVLTIGLVVLLNNILGDPFGTLALAALYLLAIGVVLGRREVRKKRERAAAARRQDAPVLTVEHPAAHVGTADELPREMPPAPRRVPQGGRA